ncbi:MAG: calcium/sodium antiporter [Pseudobutyrivibrio sp.]|nr:calcium/sodium antiporter [Pseudobutyrivibrio sp.]
MMINILFLIVGFFMLVKGADIFVDGSAALAKNFKVSSLIIGLTIVACGTSAPELAISTSAALRGSSEIALSNIVGSNTFNLLGILGICALIYPLAVSKNILKRDFPVSIVATVITFLAIGGAQIVAANKIVGQDMQVNVAVIGRGFGAALMLSYLIYVLYLIWCEKKNPPIEEDIKAIPTKRCVLYIVTGLLSIIIGGQLVVDSAETIALMLGMTETLIGFTIIAVGTSLPEFVTSFVATRKGQVELAVGNVIGSNIFNLLFILGLSAIIKPVAVNLSSVFDIFILIFVTILSMIFGFTNKKIRRF